MSVHNGREREVVCVMYREFLSCVVHVLPFEICAKESSGTMH